MPSKNANELETPLPHKSFTVQKWIFRFNWLNLVSQPISPDHMNSLVVFKEAYCMLTKALIIDIFHVERNV